jgi:hypothetical protein
VQVLGGFDGMVTPMSQQLSQEKVLLYNGSSLKGFLADASGVLLVPNLFRQLQFLYQN